MRPDRLHDPSVSALNRRPVLAVKRGLQLQPHLGRLGEGRHQAGAKVVPQLVARDADREQNVGELLATHGRPDGDKPHTPVCRGGNGGSDDVIAAAHELDQAVGVRLACGIARGKVVERGSTGVSGAADGGREQQLVEVATDVKRGAVGNRGTVLAHPGPRGALVGGIARGPLEHVGHAPCVSGARGARTAPPLVGLVLPGLGGADRGLGERVGDSGPEDRVPLAVGGLVRALAGLVGVVLPIRAALVRGADGPLGGNLARTRVIDQARLDGPPLQAVGGAVHLGLSRNVVPLKGPVVGGVELLLEGPAGERGEAAAVSGLHAKRGQGILGAGPVGPAGASVGAVAQLEPHVDVRALQPRVVGINPRLGDVHLGLEVVGNERQGGARARRDRAALGAA